MLVKCSHTYTSVCFGLERPGSGTATGAETCRYVTLQLVPDPTIGVISREMGDLPRWLVIVKNHPVSTAMLADLYLVLTHVLGGRGNDDL